MSVAILIPRGPKLGEGFSPREQLRALEHPGRSVDGTQSAAHWITSLLDLRKAVMLCVYCRVKFNPRRHAYRKFYVPDLAGKTDGYVHNGACDNCKQQTALLPGGGTTFIPEEHYRLLCIDPLEARRKARAAARVMTAWGRIQQLRGIRRPHEAARAKGA